MVAMYSNDVPSRVSIIVQVYFVEVWRHNTLPNMPSRISGITIHGLAILVVLGISVLKSFYIIPFCSSDW